MPSVIVVGIQWGDEGKGKMIDLLSEQADHIVRAQGGNNAGHTIKIGEEEYRFHLVPSGIIYPHTRCYIGGGTAIDPEVLLEEIEGLEARGVKVAGRLFISPYAHVVMPYHRELDKLYEQQKGAAAIGTTGRGIGPCYVDRVARVGIRMCELVVKDIFKKRLDEAIKYKNLEFEGIFKRPPLDASPIYTQYSACGQKLSSYLFGVENFLGSAMKGGETFLFEGAHGTFLDVTFGTYPFVTSSSTIGAGVCGGAGAGPSRIGHTLGVVKAYTTRVGNGPFPTALTKEEQASFLDHASAREIGTTTGRKRRMGWFDAPLARYGVCLNGVDSLAVTKLDVLDRLSSVKICTGYKKGNKLLDFPPPIHEELEQVEPVYETLPGWQTSTQEAARLEDLPAAARRYLDRIEELCEAPISIVSLGPERERTLFVGELFNLRQL